ncbi:MAG: DUF1732 domain-containing protein [Candidatus Cloacimonetes bacterium]|nr:DUF1732 domain-containing protein [Candidatus Cloacimonadota bacterium]
MKSMTGFGTSEYSQNNLNIKVTVRSLNSKYNSVKCKIPRNFPQLISYKIEKIIPTLIKRGNIHINITISDYRDKFPNLNAKHNLIEKYVNLLEEIREKNNLDSKITISDILNIGNIFESPTYDYDTSDFLELILNLVKKAINELEIVKKSEGDNLEEFFIKSINKIEVSLSTIELSIDSFKEDLKLKTKKRLEKLADIEFGESKDKNFLLIVSHFIEKYDITEEIIRIRSHIKKFNELITGDSEPIGISLLFLIQEIQREISTLSAKYNYVSMYPEILKIKEEVEKCKEQALNVE